MNKHKLYKSFLFAFKGMVNAFKERNFIIHLIIALFIIAAGFIFKISGLEWIVITLIIGLVFSLEIINTALEKTIDLLHPQQAPKAGEIKDLAAASVLVAAIASIIIGLIIFLPKINALLMTKP